MARCNCADPGVFGHRCGAFRPLRDNRVCALCIDGPIRGQTITLPPGTPCYYVHAPVEPPAIASPWVPGAVSLLYTTPPVITYHLSRFGLRSGDTTAMIWLASSAPGEPDARDLADLLLSDAAKQALVP